MSVPSHQVNSNPERQTVTEGKEAPTHIDPVCSEASLQQLLTQTEDAQIMGRTKTKCTRKPDGESLSSKPKAAS